MPKYRKRKLSAHLEPVPDPPSSPLHIGKRQKFENPQQEQTPNSFWDNLSQQWLTRRTLREFDRRTDWPPPPVPPPRTGKEDLDRVQLKRFARHGGPSLDRSYLTMASSRKGSKNRASTAADSEPKKAKSSGYDRVFEQTLMDHGVYMAEETQIPSNWDEIKSRVTQSRRSLSPARFSQTEFAAFKRAFRDAKSELTVVESVIPIITASQNIYHSNGDAFVNLETFASGSVVQARPDYYDGARPQDLNMSVREELWRFIMPASDITKPCLPNLFIEIGNSSDEPVVSERQALHNGAVGARAIHELRSYIGQGELFDNNAYTITSTYGAGTLVIYASFTIPPTGPNRRYDICMILIAGYYIVSDIDTFRQGASALRNARQWAKRTAGSPHSCSERQGEGFARTFT
ncbi:MAG: hypothetical protein M4579_005437 [Chaenotheca gracillima]|nr:MAG: hypothetical protein M4579_005437 [Chaenotheca gracillima]